MIELPHLEKDIFEKIHNKGFDVFIVGGFVRDSFLNKKSNDIDFATSATPEELILLFEDEFEINKVGKSFGVTLINGVEVATFRKDINDTNVEYVKTIKEDLSRRDFTINAMAIGINGELIDPFGGVEDIRNKILRFVGNPEKRIIEDPNRIVRLIRFATVLDFNIEIVTKLAVFSNIEKFNSIAKERLHLELMKVLKTSKNASKFFNLLDEFCLLDDFFREMSCGIGHDHGSHHLEDIFDHNMIAGDSISCKFPLVKLAGYLHDIGKPSCYNEVDRSFNGHQKVGMDIVIDILHELKFSNKEIEQISGLVYCHMDGSREMSKKAVRKLKNKLSKFGLTWQDWFRLRVADRKGNLIKKNFTFSELRQMVELFTAEEISEFSIHDIKLSGGEIISMFNIVPGPFVSTIQRHLFDFLMTNGFENNTKEILINKVKEFLK